MKAVNVIAWGVWVVCLFICVYSTVMTLSDLPRLPGVFGLLGEERLNIGTAVLAVAAIIVIRQTRAQMAESGKGKQMTNITTVEVNTRDSQNPTTA